MSNLVILREMEQIVLSEEKRIIGWDRRIAAMMEGLDILTEPDVTTKGEKLDILREIVIKGMQLIEIVKLDKVP